VNPSETIANGLRVPSAFGDRMILETLYESGGNAVKVSDKKILDAIREVAENSGMFLSPEGAATWEALRILRNSEFIQPSDSVVLLNTASSFKYIENI